MDAQEFPNKFAELVVEYPGYVFGTLVILAALSVWSLVLLTRDKSRLSKEVEDMKKRAILDQKYADRFGDALFDMLMADEIDRHEYKRACRRFGIAYRLSDLLVKKNDKRGRKHRIIHAIQVIHRTPDLRGKIPGPKPGEQVPHVHRRRVYIAAGKVLLRRKSAS